MSDMDDFLGLLGPPTGVRRTVEKTWSFKSGFSDSEREDGMTRHEALRELVGIAGDFKKFASDARQQQAGRLELNSGHLQYTYERLDTLHDVLSDPEKGDAESSGSLSMGRMRTAVDFLEAADDSLVEVLLNGPERFVVDGREPDRYEWTGGAIRNLARRVRNALWNLREALGSGKAG